MQPPLIIHLDISDDAVFRGRLVTLSLDLFYLLMRGASSKLVWFFCSFVCIMLFLGERQYAVSAV